MSETIQLTVTGMTCKHCVAAVEKALAAVPGVEDVVEVSLEPGSATVRGNVAVDALVKAIQDAGYGASI